MGAAWQAGRLTIGPAKPFPWPNGPNKMRVMAVINPRDELPLRAVGGIAAVATRKAIGPEVSSVVGTGLRLSE